MKLMTESIYIGHDMKRFNEIRDALDLAKIPYKHKVRNQERRDPNLEVSK